MTKRKPGARMGRPPNPDDERTSRRITLRLYPEHQAMLAALVEILDMDESEVLRAALRTLAQKYKGKLPH